MNVSEDKFRGTLQRYVFETMIPSAQGGLAQFLIGATWGAMENKLGETLRQIGAICEDGTVDMELMDKAMCHGFKATKGSVPVSLFGNKFTFRQEDWNTFKRML